MSKELKTAEIFDLFLSKIKKSKEDFIAAKMYNFVLNGIVTNIIEDHRPTFHVWSSEIIDEKEYNSVDELIPAWNMAQRKLENDGFEILNFRKDDEEFDCLVQTKA
jgi:hypothetical protein